jgi:hypothetical protein
MDFGLMLCQFKYDIGIYDAYFPSKLLTLYGENNRKYKLYIFTQLWMFPCIIFTVIPINMCNITSVSDATAMFLIVNT